MDSDVTITRAELDDAEEILELQKLAYRSEAEIYQDPTLPPLTQTVEEVKRDFDGQIFLKAEFDGRIVGSVRGSMKDRTCFIGRLIVHPDLQNRGIGTKLMTEIEKHFAKAKRFELFTGYRSKRNIYLYLKVGYQLFKIETIRPSLKLLYLEKFS
jgi:GNAT superfamily N-acetyltransferase